jgi:pimeloyl-ACP methyl ester carboxylesterase
MKDVPYQAESKVRANGIEIAYDSFGEPGATPLVLIMGFTAQMILWDEGFCEGLARRGYRVIRFDNRDVGHTSWLTEAGTPKIGAVVSAMLRGEPVQVPYKLIDMAEDTLGLMDVLGIETAHIVGMSMGGMIAQTTAIHYPERVRTLTSLSSTTGHPGLPQATPEAWETLIKPAPVDKEGFVEHAVPIWRIINGPLVTIDEHFIRERARRTFERGVSLAGYARQMAAITASGSRRKALQSVRVPALVIHGDADPLLPLAHGIDTAEAIPGAKLHIVKGMGHDIPALFWPELIEAIAGHAR